MLPRYALVCEMLAVVVEDVVASLAHAVTGGGDGLGGGGVACGLLGGEDGGLAAPTVSEGGKVGGQDGHVGIPLMGAQGGGEAELDDLVGADVHAVVVDASRLHADHGAVGRLTGQPLHAPTFLAM